MDEGTRREADGRHGYKRKQPRRVTRFLVIVTVAPPFSSQARGKAP